MKSVTAPWRFEAHSFTETQLTVRSVEAMLRMEGDVIFDLSNVDCIDEIGINALHYLIRSIHKRNGIAHYALTPQDALVVDQPA
jgi:anti-anti-sigma regulatory factor